MSASKLAGVKAERLHSGDRFCFYGFEAIGKTTLAADAEAPIFADVEDGSRHLTTSRYPFRSGPGGHLPNNLAEFYEMIADLHDNDHPFKTLVVDTIDALETLVYRHILARDSGSKSMINPSGKRLDTIEAYGFGKGFTIALDEWRNLLSQLDKLRLHRGMNVILLGHLQVKRFSNPDGEDWDRYQLRVQDTDRASVAGLIKSWVDVLGFCTWEQGAGKLSDATDLREKAKGWSTGRRLIMLERAAAYDAKSRIAMPSSIEMETEHPWAPLARAISAGRDLDAPALQELIEREVARIGSPGLAEKVTAAIKGANGDVATLSRYLNDLRRREQQHQEEETNAA